jgi:hypothetical protein
MGRCVSIVSIGRSDETCRALFIVKRYDGGVLLQTNRYDATTDIDPEFFFFTSFPQ